jgi:hypothetical protein
MRRIRIVGLCLVAVFAFGAMAMTSTASAGTYKWCRSQKKGPYIDSRCRTHARPGKGKYILNPVEPCVPTKHGEFLNSTCTLHSKPVKHGKYEITRLRGFTSVSRAARLDFPELGPDDIQCRASTDIGEITGPKTDVDRMTFTGCEFEGLECESAGPNSTASEKSGVIITNLLHSKLVDNPEQLPETVWGPAEGPSVGEVWDELVSVEHTPYITEIDCGGGVVDVRVMGWIAGVYTSGVDAMTKTTTVKFGESPAGTQGLLVEAFTGGFPPWVPAGGAGLMLEMEEEITTESEIEVAA